MMRIPKRRADLFKKPDDGPVYLTEEGFAQLKDRLARLKHAAPGLAAEAQRTAAYGDRSDNAEYKLAKSALRRTNWRILEIEDQIKRVAIIPQGPDAAGKVQIGSEVVLKDDSAASAAGEEKIFRILGSDESDPARGRISYLSPLGVALMGHKKGDVVISTTLAGTRKYLIREVR